MANFTLTFVALEIVALHEGKEGMTLDEGWEQTTLTFVVVFLLVLLCWHPTSSSLCFLFVLLCWYPTSSSTVLLRWHPSSGVLNLILFV